MEITVDLVLLIHVQAVAVELELQELQELVAVETVELENHGLEILQIMLEVAEVLVNQGLDLDREELAAEVPDHLVSVEHLETELTV
tara:strand:- start:246 stop:506 length:261 start_codon:yes stop_codon:yes gene_type:complete